MAYVVNMQSFKTLDNRFVIKELCISELHTKSAYHYVFKPTVNYNSLSHKMQKRVDYVTKYVHGLKWDSGDTSESEAIATIKWLLDDAKRVYIKGSENVAFLKKILNHDVSVIDLDIFDYRGSRTIYEKRNQNCGYPHSGLRCALQKVIAYVDWLEKHLEKNV